MAKGAGRGKNPNSIKALLDHAIKPGEKRNPRGRPVGSRDYKTVIKEIIDVVGSIDELGDDDKTEKIKQIIMQVEEATGKTFTRREIMIYAQVRKAMRGDSYAFNILADREEGKPKQEVSATVQTYEQFLDELTKGEGEEK